MNFVDLFEPTEIVAGCIEIYDNVINNSHELINIAENKLEWEDTSVYIGPNENEPTIDKSIRSNMSLNINQFSYTTDPKFYNMCKTVWFYCNQYAEKYKVGFYSTEPAQILRYSPGEYYEPHTDAAPNLPRIISALLYLNEVEEGGETEFINFNIKIKPKPGRLVIFPSNYAYQHAALSPKKGTKYVSVFWMRG